MTMYKIDWKKYLSSKRFRDSKFDKEKESSKGFISEEMRNGFESDLGRVIFSSAIRRMHDKTQVIPLTSGDSVHTRLTHSIEVMNIAMSLGTALCRSKEFKDLYDQPDELFELERSIPKILAAAGFIHDVGNPPFGHFGETIIQNYFKNYLKNHSITDKQNLDFTNFDGNAQGFRVVTKLQYIGDLSGLNLTYATLAAYLKYPNKGEADKKGYIGNHKHGIYHSEIEIFDKLVYECNLKDGEKIKRHPLAFLVEAADSISYYVMDIEDGYSMGWFSFGQLVEYLNKEIINYATKKNIDLTEYYVDEKFNVLKLLNVKEQEIDHDGKLIEKNDKRKMVDLRVKLISYFVKLALANYTKHLEEIDKGTYNAELLEEDDFGMGKALGNFARRYIFTQKQIEQSELTGSSVLTGLLDILLGYVFNDDKAYRGRVKNVISKTAIKVAMHECKDYGSYHFYTEDEFAELKIEDLDQYSKLRMVVDFVSGMTDKYAVTLYQQLSGQRL